MAINSIPSEQPKIYSFVISANSPADKTDTTGYIGINLPGPFPPGVYKFGMQYPRSSGETVTLPDYLSWVTTAVPSTWTNQEYGEFYFSNSIAAYQTFYLASTVTSLTAWYLAGYFKLIQATTGSNSELSYQDGKFWIFGNNKVHNSTDGITWTSTTATLTGSGNGMRMIFGSGETEKYLLHFIGGGVSYYFTSTNGTAWTERTFPTTFIWSDSGHYNGTYYAIGYDSGVAASKIYSSTDGITWTQRYNSASGGSFNRLVYGAGEARQFVAVGASQTAVNLVVSTDGITWATASNPTGLQLYSAIYEGGSYYAYPYNNGSPTFAITSTDGVTWATTGTSYTPIINLFQKINTNEYVYLNGNQNYAYLSTSLTNFTNVRPIAIKQGGSSSYFQLMGVYFDNGIYKYWTQGASGNGAYANATIDGGAPDLQSDPIIIERLTRSVTIA